MPALLISPLLPPRRRPGQGSPDNRRCIPPTGLPIPGRQRQGNRRRGTTATRFLPALEHAPGGQGPEVVPMAVARSFVGPSGVGGSALTISAGAFARLSEWTNLSPFRSGSVERAPPAGSPGRGRPNVASTLGSRGHGDRPHGERGHAGEHGGEDQAGRRRTWVNCECPHFAVWGSVSVS